MEITVRIEARHHLVSEHDDCFSVEVTRQGVGLLGLHQAVDTAKAKAEAALTAKHEAD